MSDEEYEGAVVLFAITKGNKTIRVIRSRYVDPLSGEFGHYADGKYVIDYKLKEGEFFKLLRHDIPSYTQLEVNRIIQSEVSKHGLLYMQKCPSCGSSPEFYPSYRIIMLGCQKCNYSTGSSNFDYVKLIAAWNDVKIGD